MADWQGIALAISSTTAMLAVGAPFGLRWWEEHGRRKQERKQAIEQHLFFVLENYGQQWANFYNWQSQWQNARRNNEPAREYSPSEIIVEGFQSHLIRLRTLTQTYGLSDDGFCNEVETYLRRTTTPVARDSILEEQVAAMNEFAKLVQDQRDSPAVIEAKAMKFLQNIEEKFG